MTNLNFCPDAPSPLRSVVRFLLIARVAAHLLNAASASRLNHETQLYQRHDWVVGQDFPGGPVHALAQTADGYLWIGSEKGLFRFDGFNFTAFNPVDPSGSAASPIEALTTDAAGSLWIQERNLTLLHYAKGKFDRVLRHSLRTDERVTAMCRGQNGDLLFLVPSKGILQYGAGGLSTLFVTSAVPNFLVISMAQTADGTIWLGTRDAGLFSLGQDHRLLSVQESRDWKINSLLPVAARRLWIGTDSGAAVWNGGALTAKGIAGSLAHSQIFAMLQDRRSNVWISSSRGLVCFDPKGAAIWKQPRDSLSNTVNAVFEDREGNIWLGTDQGLTRLRESPFSSYSASASFGAESISPVYVDDEGRTWSAAPNGGLISGRSGQIERVSASGLDKDVVLSIGGRKDTVWIGRRRGGLTQIRSQNGLFRSTTYTHRQGLAQDTVYSLHESSDGSVWAGTLTDGVSRLINGRFKTYTTADGLASNTVSAIAESSGSTMWFGTPKGLSEFSSGTWRTYAGGEGLPPGGVSCLFVDSAGVVWIGTPRGLGFLRSGRFQSTWDAAGVLQEKILGISEDRGGWLWVATTNHIVTVNRQKALSGLRTPGNVREFGLPDGLLGTSGVSRSRCIVSDSKGKIWISTNRGISVVDPAWLSDDRIPVLTHILAVSADDDPIRDQLGDSLSSAGNEVLIPASRKRIKIAYVGLSLPFPERVKFRYKLDGFDQDWTEPLLAREAVYTNLAPGAYLFHVKASQADQIWDSPDATLRLQVAPALWQTWEFRLACGLASLFLCVAAYRFRLNQFSERLKLRFEERLSERTRIAQELHDTLLQGFLSASMQLHVARGRLSRDSPAMPPLKRAMELIDQASREGRTTLRGLRSNQPDSYDLEKAFSCLPLELGSAEKVAFRVIVVGPKRLLEPVLRDDVYRIGREALLNAFRHSQGEHIEVELDYAEERFRLFVRDDGAGIDSQLLKSGRDGHWGLTGMRERAHRIGAQLSLWSSAAAGTEVVLAIPAQIAYRIQPPNGSRRPIRALLSHIFKR